MKQCPQCGSIYSDDTLNFCLTDRSGLIPVSSSVSDEPTVVLDRAAAPRTTQVIQAEKGVSPVFKYLAIALGIFLLLLAGAGFAAWSFWSSRAVQTQQAGNTSNQIVAATPSPTPASTPARTTTPNPTQTPQPIPQKDPGTTRITFRKGSVGETVNGTIVSERSFVLRTMEDQLLTARVGGSSGCVTFDDGDTSTEMTTSSGDTVLTLVNTCREPANFSLKVTVR